ncbi:MAG: calcium-binding protein [Alphaproteobacteria bacterium]|nr:calcium-binding protein [Alphaproteobacteria bacterium]
MARHDATSRPQSSERRDDDHDHHRAHGHGHDGPHGHGHWHSHGHGHGHDHDDDGASPTVVTTSVGLEITGTEDNDVLVGGLGRDTISGGDGNDILIGAVGNDTLIGGAGDDNLVGGSGIDMASYRTSTAGVTVDLSVSGPQDTGGAGVDNLVSIENVTGGTGDDVLTGDAGANVLAGYLGNDNLDGGAGDDVLAGGAGDDLMDGGAGFDTASYDGITGDLVVSLALDGAQDTGAAGSDTLVSIEKVVGGSGDDYLVGNTLDNVLAGGAGDDLLAGGDGNDTLVGGLGTDGLFGEEGSDTASYFAILDDVAVDLRNDSSHQDTGGAGLDLLNGIENLIGGQGNDRLHGSDTTNIIDGSAGNDTIWGGGGTDYLTGGAGDDVLIGGAARDRMAGGAGADVFRIESNDDSGTDWLRDVIADFSQAEGDVIDLSLIDADPTTDGDQAFDFTGFGGVLNGTPGQLTFTQNDGRTIIEGDINGDGIGDLQIELAGTYMLSNDDFYL